MSRNRFDELSEEDRQLLFEALLFCLESGSGIGIPRYDQGHVDYADGADDTIPPSSSDTPERNTMFQMLQELSLHICDDKDRTMYTRFAITTWKEFCKKVRKHSIHPLTYTPLYLR